MADRNEISKTHKLFIGGKFPRSESGVVIPVLDSKGETYANVSQASRKDFRNTVEAALAAQGVWQKATPYLRSQVLYRISEMLEGRKAEFASILELGGYSAGEAKKEIEGAIDRAVHYAGWCDKYSALGSTVNPVAGPFLSTSQPRPVGLVTVVAHGGNTLSGMLDELLSVIAGGNVAIVLCSDISALLGVALAEVCATSDVPGGVVNILTTAAPSEDSSGLAIEAAQHHEVDSIACYGAVSSNSSLVADIEREAAASLTRVVSRRPQSTLSAILAFQETKTTWQPAIGT